MRQINCSGCNAHMGEIRDARLRKGIVFLCADCETKRVRATPGATWSGAANVPDVIGDLMNWAKRG